MSARTGSARRPSSACPSSRSDAAPAHRADRLAVALHRLQPADQRRAEDEADHQRGQARRARAERDVAEQIEQDELVGKRPREVDTASGGLRMRVECIDHQLHPAAEAALDQDGVAWRDARAPRSAPGGRSAACAPRIGSARRRTARASAGRRRTRSRPRQRHRRQARDARRAQRHRVPACHPAPRRAAAPAAGAAQPAPRASMRDCRCSSRPAAARCRRRTAIGRRAPRPATGAKFSSARACGSASSGMPLSIDRRQRSRQAR